MAPPDPYAVLGIAAGATDEEVRAAYRARSMLLHPDLHQGRPAPVRLEAERAMAQLTAAYEAVRKERSMGPPAGSGAEPLAFRLGRQFGRTALGREASEAGEQPGSVVFRLGWLVGRRRSRPSGVNKSPKR